MCTEENKTSEEQKKEIFRHEQGEITVNLNSVKEKAKATGKTLGERAKKILSVVKAAVKKRKKIIIPAVIILAVGIGAAVYGMNHLGYRGKLNESIHMVNSRKASENQIAKAILPETAYENYDALMSIIGEVDMVDGELERIEEKMDQLYVRLDDNFGSDAKVKVKILNCEKMSSSQLRRSERRYREYYTDYLKNGIDELNSYDYEKIDSMAERFGLTSSELREARAYIDIMADDMENIDISKGYNMDIELRIKGSRDDYKTKMSMSMIRANGDWMIDYTTVDQMENIMLEVLGEISGAFWFL